MCCALLSPCFVTVFMSPQLSVCKPGLTIVPTHGVAMSGQWEGAEHFMRPAAGSPWGPHVHAQCVSRAGRWGLAQGW